MAILPTGRVQVYTTGTTFVYANVGNAGAVVHLGTCEGYPKHERRVEYEQLMNDIGGRRKPIDMAFQGMDATITLDFTVWDEGALQCIENVPRFDLMPSGVPPGSWATTDLGALMGFEGFSIQVWLMYNFANKPAYAALPRGYHYLNCVPISLGDQNGAQAMHRMHSFYVWPDTDYSLNPPMQTLYDYDFTGVPNPTNGPTSL